MTNINLSDVSNSIDTLIALPIFALLADVPADLTLKLFIPNKDNPSILSGTESQFRMIDFVADFTLPDPVDAPDVDSFPDTSKGMKDFKDAMNVYKLEGKVFNDSIKYTAARLLQHDIKRNYDRLQRVVKFVQSHDPSLFVHNEELDLWQLTLEQRTAILSVYQTHFALSPKLNLSGSFVDLVATDASCNIDSPEGIDAIIKIKNNNPSASYAFMSKEITAQALSSVYGKVNILTFIKCNSRLDTHSGGSKNSTTILANLRMLFGIAPSKGKKAATV